MNFTIREAQVDDCSRIMELVHELAVFEQAPNEVTVTTAQFIESGFGPNPVWKAFVAEHEQIIVGFALYYVRYSTWKGLTMYLEDLLVTENYRRNKVGTLLFEALIKEAREKKFGAISWQVLEWNESAVSFYKKYNPSFDGEWVNCRMPIESEASSR